MSEAISRRGISGLSGYLPMLRLDRASAAKALRFLGLGGRNAGYRSTAGWDEDALTLAAEAARNVLGNTKPDRVCFASTSAPFFERGHAPLLVDALALPSQTRTIDVAGSRRCAVSALLDALLGSGDSLIAGVMAAARFAFRMKAARIWLVTQVPPTILSTYILPENIRRLMDMKSGS